MCTKLACLRRNPIAAGPKPTLDAEAIFGLIRKRTEYGNLRNTETYEIRIPINIQPTQATRRHMCLLYTVDTKSVHETQNFVKTLRI